MATTDIQHIVGSLSPSRSAIRFIATGDEAFVVDVFAAARVTAGDVAGCFTAWINVPNILGDYGIVSCGDSAAVEFLTLSVVAGKISIEINLATDLKSHHVTSNVVIKAHKWHHVAVVQNAGSTAPKIYIDGVEAATDVTDETDNGVWFDELDLIDGGSIGAAEEAGAAGQTKEMIGAISDVKYWAIELTAAEVEADYLDSDANQGAVGATAAALASRIAALTTAHTDHWKMIDLVNSITVGNNGVKGASIIYQNAYSEFTSRIFSVVTPIVDEDLVKFAVKDDEGHLIVVKAA